MQYMRAGSCTPHRISVKIILKAMEEPVRQIATNAGLEPAFGIRANTVSPGCIAINPKGYEDKTYEGDADRIPIGRTGTGEESQIDKTKKKDFYAENL